MYLRLMYAKMLWDPAKHRNPNLSNQSVNHKLKPENPKPHIEALNPWTPRPPAVYLQTITLQKPSTDTQSTGYKHVL